jgi:hypothetical protein
VRPCLDCDCHHISLHCVDGSAQSFSASVQVEYRLLLFFPYPLVLEHPVLSQSARISSSYRILGITYLASTLASSPSTCNAAFGVTASITKWLSQFGQYSSLRRGCQFPDLTFANKRVSESSVLTPYLSSQSFVFFRNAFLHFLQIKVCANDPLEVRCDQTK